MQTYKSYYQAPIGNLKVITSLEAVVSIEFVQEKIKNKDQDKPLILYRALKQLDQYFKGERKQFDVPLYLEGTPFQKSVWEALMDIPYGTVATYKDVARWIGNEKAVRAVGGANHKNKIPIMIPCHRVIGSNQKLTGYRGGLSIKEWLLHHEGWKK